MLIRQVALTVGAAHTFSWCRSPWILWESTEAPQGRETSPGSPLLWAEADWSWPWVPVAQHTLCLMEGAHSLGWSFPAEAEVETRSGMPVYAYPLLEKVFSWRNFMLRCLGEGVRTLSEFSRHPQYPISHELADVKNCPSQSTTDIWLMNLRLSLLAASGRPGPRALGIIPAGMNLGHASSG